MLQDVRWPTSVCWTMAVASSSAWTLTTVISAHVWTATPCSTCPSSVVVRFSTFTARHTFSIGLIPGQCRPALARYQADTKCHTCSLYCSAFVRHLVLQLRLHFTRKFGLWSNNMVGAALGEMAGRMNSWQMGSSQLQLSNISLWRPSYEMRKWVRQGRRYLIIHVLCITGSTDQLILRYRPHILRRYSWWPFSIFLRMGLMGMFDCRWLL